MRRTLAAFVLCAGLLLIASSASAGAPPRQGDRSGILLPGAGENLRLRDSQVTFSFSQPDLFTARVHAVYTVENPTDQPVETELQWAFVDRFYTGRQTATITVDGAPAATRESGDTDWYRPALTDWLDQHPDVQQAFRAASPAPSDETLDRLTTLLSMTTESKAANRADTLALLQLVHGEPTSEQVRQLINRVIPLAADPARAPEVWAGWRTEWGHQLSVTGVAVSFPPHSTREIRIQYPQEAWERLWYEFRLQPLERWSAAGPTRVTVELPKSIHLDANVPARKQGDSYILDLSRPPAELTFQLVRPGSPKRVAYSWGPIVAAVSAGGLAGALLLYLLRRRRQKGGSA